MLARAGNTFSLFRPFIEPLQPMSAALFVYILARKSFQR